MDPNDLLLEKLENKFWSGPPASPLWGGGGYTTTVDPPPSCGFPGGCIWRLNAVGLMGSIEAGLTKIEVCGLECEYIYEDTTVDPVTFLPSVCASSSHSICCRLPGVQTRASLNEFILRDEEELGTANTESKFATATAPLPPPAAS